MTVMMNAKTFFHNCHHSNNLRVSLVFVGTHSCEPERGLGSTRNTMLDDA